MVTRMCKGHLPSSVNCEQEGNSRCIDQNDLSWNCCRAVTDEPQLPSLPRKLLGFHFFVFSTKYLEGYCANIADLPLSITTSSLSPSFLTCVWMTLAASRSTSLHLSPVKCRPQNVSEGYTFVRRLTRRLVRCKESTRLQPAWSLGYDNIKWKDLEYSIHEQTVYEKMNNWDNI